MVVPIDPCVVEKQQQEDMELFSKHPYFQKLVTQIEDS